ncbi:MAG TPA: transcription-repair coupling factor [Oscillospiraceae bacterium]|nr:transcription-repair coupling factor [Oscillospiraceae bacterium]
MKNIAAAIAQMSQLQPLFEGLHKTTRSQLLYGLDESARHMVMAAIYEQTRRSVIIVTADAVHANKVYEDLLAVFGENKVFLFPGKELLYYHDLLSDSGDTAAQRLHVMKELAADKQPIVVTTVSGLVEKMCPREQWQAACFTVKVNAELGMEQLLKLLVTAGYERVELVEVAGQFSVRGGIADIFPIGEATPYRIEFFGDLIESIRSFDPLTQRSQESLQSLQLAPVREVIVGEEQQQQALTALAAEQQKLAAQKRQEIRGGGQLAEKLAQEMEKIKEGLYYPSLERLLLYFYPQPATLLDWFPAEALIFLNDPQRCEQAVEQLKHELGEIQSTLFAQGELLAHQVEMTWDYEEVLSLTKQQIVAFALFTQQGFPVPYRRTISFSAKPVPRFLGQWELFCQEVEQWRQLAYRVVIITSTRQRSSGITDILAERNIPSVYSLSQPDLAPRTVTLLHGSLESGFILPELKLAVLAEQDILPQRKKRRRLKGKEGVRVGDYQELQVGDFVVHEQHGIGQYLGLRTLEVSGIQRDYLYIQYAGNDKLYLPIEQIDVVRKYLGAEGKRPKLSALGGGEWSRVKARVQSSVQELAKELLALYAAREAEPGHAFAADHDWQQDFEAAFPFEETEDQLQAIKEIKEDMEKSRAMDRLLCGDVGYGKTEVAMRAAFKAIMDGMQAAFLVPTTVLAQQHYRTFLERLEGFPVKVGILSRFQSTAQQKVTLQGLEEGSIDLLVGTHRMLSQDVRFNKLGLLVVDEEQRFGVRHKERIKMLKKNLDVLTMTATPIPRTLHMSLAGVRDMSVIETPPEDRYPIQTYVLEYSDSLIREAILRELGRGGQVYFVHNRVQSIERWAAQLRKLLPEAKLAVGHGQMPEGRLEKIMLDFLDGEYDVLLSTTIVEAGLDIPNVNTIIIHDADKFGLAQLYQLRGRVGRSNRIAYAYLTYQKDKVLTEVAEKRLQAIKEFTELGSGFKIALRDLEIRGSGNILGPEQHGHMMAVGFDMYMKLLEDAINAYKGTKKEQKMLPRIEVEADAYLPASYISDTRQKIVFYQKVAAVETAEEVAEAREELQDRYGSLPKAADNLLQVALIRLLASDLEIMTITEERREIMLRFATKTPLASRTLQIVAKRHQGRLTMAMGKQFVLAFRKQFKEDREKLIFLSQLLNELKILLAKQA